MLGFALSPFWCGIVSIAIGALIVVLAIAALLGIVFVVSVPFMLMNQRREEFNSLSIAERSARMEKARRRREIWGKIGSGIYLTFFACLVLVLLWAFGSPVCDAVFRHGR